MSSWFNLSCEKPTPKQSTPRNEQLNMPPDVVLHRCDEHIKVEPAEDDVKPLKRFAKPLVPLQIQKTPSKKFQHPSHNKKFTCDMCYKGVGTKGGLKYHIQAHLNGRRFKCDKCPKSYATKNDLDTHYKRHLNSFTCDYCSRVFASKHYLQEHISARHLPKVHPCKDCCESPRFFSSKRLVKRHRQLMKINSRRKELPKIKSFRCKMCGYKTASSPVYTKHCKGRELLKHKCGRCGKRFPCQKLMLDHKKQEHPSPGEHCKICDKWANNIKEHKIDRHTLRTCDVCKIFKTFQRDTLRTHKKNCKAGKKAVNAKLCPICKIFFGNMTLFSHVRKEHPDVESLDASRKFHCSLCTRFYTTKKKLDAHYEKHVGSEFTCDVCSESFAAKKHLRAHISVGHLPKSIPCADCCKPPQLFSTKLVLKQHYAIKAKIRELVSKTCKHCKIVLKHTGTYVVHCAAKKCKKCGAHFSCCKSFRDHMKSMHTGRQYCKTCGEWVNEIRSHNYEQHTERTCAMCNFKTNSRQVFRKHKCGSDLNIARPRAKRHLASRTCSTKDS